MNKFFEDFRNNLIGQYEESAGYKIVCRNSGFNPHQDLKNEDDIENVPYVTTSLFKKSNQLFLSLLRTDVKNIEKWTVSSSTSGDPSIVGRKKEDIEKLREFVDKDEDAFRNKRDYECIFFPKAEHMKSIGRAELFGKTVESYLGNIVDLFVYRDDTIYALKPSDKGLMVDINAFIEFIKAHDGKEHYASLGGSTPLLFSSILNIKDKIKHVELGNNALVHTGGGGWDGRKGNINIGTEIERWRFVEEVSNFLGVPEENFTDTYSFTENSFTMTGHYSKEYKDYLFHVPEWGRIIIRDIKTLKPLHNDGDRGLVQVLNAYGTQGFAGASVLVDDIGEIVSNKECPACGYHGMTIKLIGRVKGTEAKGCGATLSTGGAI